MRNVDYQFLVRNGETVGQLIPEVIVEQGGRRREKKGRVPETRLLSTGALACPQKTMGRRAGETFISLW